MIGVIDDCGIYEMGQIGVIQSYRRFERSGLVFTTISLLFYLEGSEI